MNKDQVKIVSLALAFVALGLPEALQAQPPEVPPPMTLMVLGTDSDETIDAESDSRNRWELVAVRLTRGAPIGGISSALTVADFDREGDGQLTRDEFPTARPERGQQTIPPQ